jgi:hypothetical protein
MAFVRNEIATGKQIQVLKRQIDGDHRLRVNRLACPPRHSKPLLPMLKLA